MSSEGAQIAGAIERMLRATLDELRDLPEETLNRPLPLPETNSLFALATHQAGSAEFLVLKVGFGQAITRDRDAEFRATGSIADLEQRYERLIGALHAALDGVDPAALDKPADLPAANRGWVGDGPVSVRDCLLHVIDHEGIHCGHIQLTKQMLAASNA
jgi:hypothetical protein